MNRDPEAVAAVLENIRVVAAQLIRNKAEKDDLLDERARLVDEAQRAGATIPQIAKAAGITTVGVHKAKVSARERAAG